MKIVQFGIDIEFICNRMCQCHMRICVTELWCLKRGHNHLRFAAFFVTEMWIVTQKKTRSFE